jgi:hypothetical protein
MFIGDTFPALLGTLHDMFLQVDPVWPGPFIPAEHKLDHVLDFLRVGLSQSIDIVLHSLPVNAGLLVTVTLLVLKL